MCYLSDTNTFNVCLGHSSHVLLHCISFLQDLSLPYVYFYRDAYSETRLIGRILIFSGRSGRILRWVETPDKKESYFSPLIYTLKNGTDMVIFGTGGETHGGSLYVIKLTDLYYGKIRNALAIYTDKQKGWFQIFIAMSSSKSDSPSQIDYTFG